MATVRKIRRSELIQIIIPKNAGQPKTKIQFPDNQNLRNAFFLGIEAYTAETIPKSILTANNVIALALAKSIFVTFQGYDGNNFSQQHPLLNFKTIHTSFPGDPASEDFKNEFPSEYTQQRVNWPKSYIEIADATLISAAEDQVVLLNVHYCYDEVVEAKAKKASFRKQS